MVRLFLIAVLWAAASGCSGADVAPVAVEYDGQAHVSLRGGVGCWIADASSVRCWDGDSEWVQQGDFVQVSAGSLFACGVTAGGEVRCWSREHGEGKYLSWYDSVEDIPVPEGREVRSVAVDGPHLCVVYIDATLGCHGRKFWGPLPAVEGVVVPKPGPLPEGQFTHMSTGGWDESDSAGLSCAVRADSGELACWGYHGEERAPTGVFAQVSVSAGLMPGNLSVGGIQISYPSAVQICGVHPDGRLSCRSEFQGDDGPRFVEHYAPQGAFAQVSAGHRHICGLRTDGAVECWVLSRAQMLPEGGEQPDGDEELPVAHRQQVGADLTEIAVGRDGSACGVDTDGRLACWEIDVGEQTGCGDMSDPCDIAVDTDASGGLLLSGTGYSTGKVHLEAGFWTSSFDGAGDYSVSISRSFDDSAPDGSGGPRCHPGTDSQLGGVRITQEGETVVYGSHSLMVGGDLDRADCTAGDFDVVVHPDSDGAWTLMLRHAASDAEGVDSARRLSRIGHEFIDLDVAAMPPDQWHASPQPYVCGVHADGELECWGAERSRTATPPVGMPFAEISVGSAQACGIEANGATICWHWNWDEAPVPDLSSSRPKRLAVGESLICQIDARAALRCYLDGGEVDPWDLGLPRGDEAQTAELAVPERLGQSFVWLCWINDEQRLTCSTPAAANSPQGSYRAVSAENRYACGVTVKGSVKCWDPQLAFNNEPRPPLADYAPPTGDRFVDVALGAHHGCALAADGTVECWGWDRHGQSSPPDGQFTKIASTVNMTCGLRPGGDIECWGFAPPP